MKRTDLIASLVIGELSALLILAISRVIIVPTAARPLLGWLPLGFPILTLALMAAGALVNRWIAVAHQLVKFLLVGGLNFLIDLGTLNLLIAATGIASGFYANVFKAVAFLVAVTSSFLWNKFWTFGARSTAEAGRQFTGFFLVSVVGLAINVGTFAVLNGAIRPPAGIPVQTWASIAAAGAAAVGLGWNFIGYKFLVFRRPQR